ncbi:MAG TPA: hypothetical protein DCM14_05590 [Clostridiales bacterium UBA8153]|nr:hypothetical protein [Clostridiales bacterium UBA8153]
MDVGDLKLALRPEGLWPHTITQEYGPAAVAVVAPPGPPPPGGARLLLVDATRLTVTRYVTGQPLPGSAGGVGCLGLDTPVGEWRISSRGI